MDEGLNLGHDAETRTSCMSACTALNGAERSQRCARLVQECRAPCQIDRHQVSSSLRTQVGARPLTASLDLVVGDASRAESIGRSWRVADSSHHRGDHVSFAPASLPEVSVLQDSAAHHRPSVHIIDAKGKTTTQAHTVGQCWSSAILVLHGRFVPLVWCVEASQTRRTANLQA